MELGASPAAEAISLFDGKTLTGWDADPKFWKVDAGLIVGGNGDAKMPHNDFIATVKSFHNFDLHVKIKLTGDPKTGMINSGVQIRSVRVPNSAEMSGYQVDYGVGWYGKLYDESRRNKVVGDSTDPKAATAAIHEGDWNEYRIRAEGPRIRSWINGVPGLDFTETEPDIAQDGRIGIQVHGGGIARVEVKDVFITELPATPNAPTWEKLGGFKPRPKPAPKADGKKSADTKATKSGRDISYNAITSSAQTPEDERKSFTLPAGFEIELVAAESEGLGKFITTVWDAKMRMWSMTALEYPVDGNENKATSDALFAKGGRDKVVVWDNIYGAQSSSSARSGDASRGAGAPRSEPRIFADGLVMPLGVLPYRDGAFVQYGPDIRFYRDANGDGRADQHDVFLTGFGTQDSHLFPHQFTRAPGGWVFVAQGAFNYSKVRRPGDLPFADGRTEASFNNCKLARFQLDGSLWENVTAGPQNIWGFTIGREGETFMQEANDMGYPVIPYEPGIHVKTGSKERLRPYQPLMPGPLNPPQMGGTGLSGLALADDRDTQFKKHLTTDAGAKIFYLANPITSVINVVKATPDGPRYRYEKLADFITTTDRWFRPVAIAFGPDGCLYITDWYNKIISHNEVPRNHPDRDKTRGRIWRVRQQDQPRVTPPDLTKLSEKELLAQLGSASTLVTRLAWLEIIDRKATGLVPELEKIIANQYPPPDRRLAALWALEGLKAVPTKLLRELAADRNPNLRHEAARIAGESGLKSGEFVAIVAPLVDDPSPRVRAALGDALRRVPNPDTHVIELAARLGREPLPDAANDWPAYERAFERYMARWAMELHPAAVAEFLNSPAAAKLPLENRLLATLALDGKTAALALAKLMPEIKRPLQDEEVRSLAANLGEPAVMTALQSALGTDATRANTVETLLVLRTSLDPTKLTGPLTAAASLMLATANSRDLELGTRLAAEFQLNAVESSLVRVLEKGWGGYPKLEAKTYVLQPQSLAALRALASLRSERVDLFAKLAEKGEPAVRDAALSALASSRSEQASAAVLKLWPALNPSQRSVTIERLAGTKAGAQTLLASIRSGAVVREDVSLTAVEKMHTLLVGDPAMEELWRSTAGRVRRVLRLDGKSNGYAEAKIDLVGPFTIEAWVKLDPNIGNEDGILGAPGSADFNFFAGKFRVFGGPGHGDRIVAKKPMTPDAWTHLAVTRDTEGRFKIFLNGELDTAESKPLTNDFHSLDVGRVSNQKGGTAGWLTEFRVWNVVRTADEIRANFDRTFAGGNLPQGLVKLFTGSEGWGKFTGKTALVATMDFPTLLTEAEARAQEVKFAQFRALAAKPGDATHGRDLFTTICLACHNVKSQGGQVAPALDGVANTGVEALLRNILTPNAAMEGGYRKYRVETKDDELVEGLFVSEDTTSIVLRQPNVPDQRIPRANVKRAGFLNTSIMPEGLLEALKPEEVASLFAFLKTLK
ncbi:MAG: DUF1080 domain-containing protein [Verrucomicrobia bacterium]|nr:DUF1080 domain-containing protein [Verrucomicrobiota bacterium]